MRPKVILFAILVTLILGAGSFFSLRTAFQHREFYGKVVFQTDAEYQDFKLAVAQPDVRIWRVSALASEPPIIVAFDVFAPAFGYGRSHPHLGWAMLGGLSGIGFIITLYGWWRVFWYRGA